MRKRRRTNTQFSVMNLLVVTTLLAFGIRIYTLLGTGTFATLCLYSFGIAIEWLVLTYVAWRIDD